MSAATEDVLHPQRTQRSGYSYLFYAKHHGGDRRAAMWVESISRDMEFSIFDAADDHGLTDSRFWLYGLARDDEGELMILGKWGEQIAEFQRPKTNPASNPWHGYPKWPLDEFGPQNRSRQQCCPERTVFNKMLEQGLISKVERKRLLTAGSA